MLDRVTNAPAGWGRLANGMVDSPAIEAGGGSISRIDAVWPKVREERGVTKGTIKLHGPDAGGSL